ncbi:MAG TPA: M56 family metallopeptidase [Candidatus Limiplasma sp.]|nr:M56 family metallopeptidase [Candidatus Limiplasma sp.]
MTNLLESYAGVSVIMAALTLALLLLSPLLGKRYRARSLYITWIIVMLGFLVPLRIPNLIPAVTATAPAVVSQTIVKQTVQTIAADSEVQAADPAADSAEALTDATAAQSGQATASFTWISLITLVWLAGTAVALAVYCVRYILFYRNTKRWRFEIENENTNRIFARELKRAGIRKPVRLYRCQSVGSPMITGIFRPVLLLPDEDLTEDELPLVFRHELIHVKRHDLLIKGALMLTAAVHWFNPAVYLLIKQLTFWQESACDEAVVSKSSLAEKQFYSETIIRVIRRQVRMRTALSTSFYGGKNGMKRRIVAIMESGGKRRGAALWVAALVLASCMSMAFAVDIDPLTTSQGTVAYVACADADGTRMIFAPTVNDWEVPLAAYFNGTQVTITQTRESSALDEWNSVEGEDNWANVLVGGDGTATGISGWIPLTYLSETAADTLPTAVLTTDSVTGFVNVYTGNDTQSELVNAWQEGTEVTLLGRVQQWYQISVDGEYGFVPRENLSIDDAVQARFDTFLPYRFDTMTRDEYQSMLTFDALYTQKAAQYDGKGVEDWSLEDKAWYGQMEDTYVGQHDHYYQLPQEDDLQQDEAVAIAWDALLAQNSGLEGANQDDYDFNLSFYSIPVMEEDQKRWNIRITPKEESSASFEVEIASPSGEVLDTYGAL